MCKLATTLLVTAAVLAQVQDASAKLRVITSVPDLASLAKEVGGEHVRVRALSLSTQDPHFVDAKPSLVLEANRADLLIAVGLDLEVGWLPTLQVGARNHKVQRGGAGYLECSNAVSVLGAPSGRVDRSAGDVHAGGNPHYLYDPRRALACAAAIAQRMTKLDPAHAAAYGENLRRFSAELGSKIKHWEQRLHPYRGVAVVSYHKSWTYLIAWLQFRLVGTLEPKPGIAPTPRHLAQVIRAARAAKVKLLFQETYYPSRTAKLVARKIGASLVSLPGGTQFRRGQSYLQRIDAVLGEIERALK